MRKRAGLTLIEVTVAMALTGILMAAILKVVARLSRDPAVRGEVTAGSLQADQLRSLLATDLVHAERFRENKDKTGTDRKAAAGKGFSLQTRALLAAKTLELRHLPSTVTYDLRTVGSVNWLIRTQTTGRGESMTGLVCRGVHSVRIESPGNEKAKPDRQGWRAAGPVLDVTVQFQDGRPDVSFSFTRGSL